MPGGTLTSASRVRELGVIGVLIGVGVLHLVPGIALVAPARLITLYGVGELDTDLLVLLRHRALLLAMLGVFLVVAAVRPGWRRTAFIGGLLSNVVFVLLTVTVPTSTEISRVAVIDLVVLPLLIIGLVLSARGATRPTQAPRNTADVG